MSSTSGDTVQGSSFALMVPNDETTEGVTATYADLVRFGAADQTDEAKLNSDPSNPSSSLMGVPSPFGPGGLSYTLDSLQFVGPNGYVRVGAPAPYEKWLTNDPAKPLPPYAPGAADPPTEPQPPNDNGVYMHSNTGITLFAPTITQTTNSAAYATWNDSGKISILSGQSNDGEGTLTNATYQVADNLSTTVGNTLTTITGQSATVWLGADASTGFGSLLWSNFGVTQNIFGGQIVNLTNGNAEVIGFKDVKFADTNILSPKELVLGVGGSDAQKAMATSFTTATYALNTVSAAVLTVTSALIATRTGVAANKVDHSNVGTEAYNQSLEGVLSDFKTEMWVLTGLAAALQVAGIAMGISLWIGAKLTALGASATITLTNGKIELSAGGTVVTIGTGGFSVNAGNPVNVTAANVNMTNVTLQANNAAVLNQDLIALIRGPLQVMQPWNVDVMGVAPPVQNISFTCNGLFSVSGVSTQFRLPAV